MRDLFGTWFYLLPVIAVLVATHAVAAQRPIPDGTVREGTLSFDGHATMGDFVGTTHVVTGHLIGGPSLADVRGWVEAPVHTLETGNGRRDRDMNSSMESKKYPSIRFDLTGATPGADPAGDTTDVVLHGKFTIHGVTRDVDLPSRVVFGPGTIAVQSQFPLNLKSYRIKGLSKMLGMLKMDERITVHVALVFATTPAASVAATGEQRE